MSLPSIAQESDLILTYDAFIEKVVLEHPLAKKAALQSEIVESMRMRAKGGFDPQLDADWNNKYFIDKNYYRIFDGKISVPTKYGFQVVGQYQFTDGIYLNPEKKTADNGLWALGIEANLLQGLLIDENRIAIKQAELFEERAEVEQELQLNDLIMKASQAYIYWQTAVQTQRIIDTSLIVAESYFEATKESYLFGAKPAIDTLEAYLLVQDRLLLIQKNAQALMLGKQLVEQFLWLNNAPVLLNQNILPEDLNDDWEDKYNRPLILDSLLLNHPVLLDKQLTIKSYELDQRLKKEKLKPKLKVKYNPLIQTATDNWAPSVFSLDNYKFGIDFSTSLFLRKERADVRLGQLKIQSANFELEDKRNVLRNKIEMVNNKIELLNQQLILQRANSLNYFRMLEAEQTRFGFGESSVFILNKRQEKYLEVQIKEVELTAKRQLGILEYLFVAGEMEIILFP